MTVEPAISREKQSFAMTALALIGRAFRPVRQTGGLRAAGRSLPGVFGKPPVHLPELNDHLRKDIGHAPIMRSAGWNEIRW